MYSIQWRRPRELAKSPECEHLLAYPDAPLPLGLDGSWASHSSQMVAASFSTGWKAGSDWNLMGTNNVAFDGKSNLTTPGSHTVSIALVQEVHASGPSPPLFKLLGLNSC